jgi:hypothetical protein
MELSLFVIGTAYLAEICSHMRRTIPLYSSVTNLYFLRHEVTKVWLVHMSVSSVLFLRNMIGISWYCRSHRPSGLRQGSTADHLLGLCVIPPGALVSISRECCV